MSKSSKNQIVSNLAWRFFERCGAQGVTFIVSIVLARLLAPEVYGTIALVTVFITILQVFVDSGLGNALIQKKNADDIDFSTVFYFNIAVCLILYAIIFVLAPLIADFYKLPELTAVIRVLSLIIVISGVKNVQQAYVSRNMLFKRFFFSTLGGTIGAAIIGIVMAYLGFGVWALVAQMLFNSFVDTLILWITVKWRPKFVFSKSRLKGLFSYGWKLLVSTLIDTVYNELRQLIIGKLYSSKSLAYYDKGKQFPNSLMKNIDASIDSVLLPALSSEQDNMSRIKTLTRRSIKTSSYILWPLMLGLAACATPLIRLVLTEKWLPCVPFLQIFCITFALQPIQTANLNAIKAIGQSGLFLRLNIIKKIIGILILLVTMKLGVLVMALSLLATTVINGIINAFPNKKLLNYSYIEQIKDIFPYMALSLFMSVIVYPIQLLSLPDIITLIIQVILGAAIYIAGSVILKLDSFEYLWGTVKSIIKKH